VTKLKAAVFMPEEEISNVALISRCLDHISKSGYTFDSIVTDWQQLMTMLRERTVQIVVYARPDHIDPSWTPRFELAGEGPGSIAVTDTAEGVPPSRSSRRRERRPRIIER